MVKNYRKEQWKGHCKMMIYVVYLVLSASSASTSPWQEFGLHQQPSVLPFNSDGSLAINSGFASIHCLYFAITSSREPSLPILKGLPHFDGLPMYTSKGSFLQWTTRVVLGIMIKPILSWPDSLLSLWIFSLEIFFLEIVQVGANEDVTWICHSAHH